MNKIVRIAIDGPSGAGKSTIARELATKLNIDYIDTGAMYRATGYKLLKEKTCLEDEESLRRTLDSTEIDFTEGHIILDGEIADSLIRTPEMSKQASICSAIGPVREKLVELQRAMGKTKSVIMDGRDIGTNVFPDAEFKFYLVASPEVRADRRYRELIEKGQDVEYNQVLEDIKARDLSDMTRKLNPLRKAEDAIEVNSDDMSIEQVTEYMYNIIIEK